MRTPSWALRAALRELNPAGIPLATADQYERARRQIEAGVADEVLAAAGLPTREDFDILGGLIQERASKIAARRQVAMEQRPWLALS
jgi:hypothetical protein